MDIQQYFQMLKEREEERILENFAEAGDRFRDAMNENTENIERFIDTVERRAEDIRNAWLNAFADIGNYARSIFENLFSDSRDLVQVALDLGRIFVRLDVERERERGVTPSNASVFARALLGGVPACSTRGGSRRTSATAARWPPSSGATKRSSRRSNYNPWLAQGPGAATCTSIRRWSR